MHQICLALLDRIRIKVFPANKIQYLYLNKVPECDGNIMAKKSSEVNSEAGVTETTFWGLYRVKTKRQRMHYPPSQPHGRHETKYQVRYLRHVRAERVCVGVVVGEDDPSTMRGGDGKTACEASSSGKKRTKMRTGGGTTLFPLHVVVVAAFFVIGDAVPAAYPSPSSLSAGFSAPTTTPGHGTFGTHVL